MLTHMRKTNMHNVIAIRYQSSIQDETGYTLDSFDFITIDGDRETLTVPHEVGANAAQLYQMLVRRGARLPAATRKSMRLVQRVIKDGPIAKMRFVHDRFEVL
jgi:hypothetical protein